MHRVEFVKERIYGAYNLRFIDIEKMREVVRCGRIWHSLKRFSVLNIRLLNLHLLQTVLPDGNIGGDTILAVVEKNNPIV